MAKIPLTPFPILKTDRLTLRQLKETDVAEIASLRSDESVNKYLDRPKQSNLEEARAFILKINEAIKQNKSIYWAICLKDQPGLIGTICLWNFSENSTKAELGYELNPGFQGQGLMSEALLSVLDYNKHILKLNTLEAYTHKDNESSIQLLLRSNFKPDLKRKDKENADLVIFTWKISEG